MHLIYKNHLLMMDGNKKVMDLLFEKNIKKKTRKKKILGGSTQWKSNPIRGGVFNI